MSGGSDVYGHAIEERVRLLPTDPHAPGLTGPALRLVELPGAILTRSLRALPTENGAA